tara:strand:- start:3641 stop:4726 length:1086 start_codon:yes stop_codon:yes gene_type:complete
MSEQLRILVTGGAGFIGSAVIRYILFNTEHQVINVDKLTYAGNLESLNHVKDSTNYSFYETDICDKKKILNLINDCKPTHIMHLAAESHVDRSIDSPEDFINTNILGTYSLLEAFRDLYLRCDDLERNNMRFHHISTDEVYGDLKNSNQFFTEQTPYDPSSPYSASKAASDHIVRAWSKTFNLPTLVTNCSNNYGPYHFPEKLIPHIILNAINGNELPIYGDGMQIRDWLYVDDHANALYKVATEGKIGETYNIGGNNEKTNLEVVHTICEILEELAPIKPNNINYYKDLITFVADRPGHDLRYAIDASKIYKELGWKPSETFDSGLRKTVKWFLENHDWWENILSGRYKMNRMGNQINER